METVEECEYLIVGAGPAGSPCARILALALFSSGWLTRRLALDRWFLHRGQRLLAPKTEET